jgi:hypothetical protein
MATWLDAYLSNLQRMPKIYHPFIIIIIIIIIIIFRTLQLTPIFMEGCITWMLF